MLRYLLVVLILGAGGPNNGNGQPGVVAPPNPVDMKNGWREFFNASGEEFQSRMELLRSNIELVVKRIDEEGLNKTAEFYQTEIDNLIKAILATNEIAPPSPPPPFAPRTSYSLQEYLELIDAIYKTENEIQDLESKISFQKYAISKIEEGRRTAYLNYLEMTGTSDEKTVLGLKILGVYLFQLYNEKRLSANEQLLSFKRKESVQQKRELDIASDRFSLNESDLETFTKTKETLLAEKNAWQKTTAIEESKVYVAFTPTTTPPEFTQALINNRAKEAILQTQIYSLDALAVMLQDGAKETDYTQWMKYHQEVKERLAFWKKSTADLLALSGQPAAEAPNEEDKQQQNGALAESLEGMELIRTLSKENFKLGLFLDLLREHLADGPVGKVEFHVLEFFGGVWAALTGWTDYILFEIGDTPVDIWSLVKAVVVIILAFWLSRIIRRYLRKILVKKNRFDVASVYTFSRVLHYVILLLGGLVALGMIGVTLSNIAIILGALGVGIGFGLQGIVNNFICGLVVLFEKQLRVGDIVELTTGQIGKISEVNVMNTSVHTFGGVDVLVPNSQIVSESVTNWTKKDPYYRLIIPFGVAYGTDVARVQEIVLGLTSEVPDTLINIPGVPNPEVRMLQFGENSLDFQLLVWINLKKSRGLRTVRSSYLLEIEKAFRKANVQIPFAQLDVHLVKETQYGDTTS